MVRVFLLCLLFQCFSFKEPEEEEENDDDDDVE